MRATAFSCGSQISRRQLDNEIAPRRALERLIELVGEAAKRVSPETRERESAIPWNAIIGMRDKLAHDYDDIESEFLWRTARNDLPPLARQLERALTTPSRRK